MIAGSPVMEVVAELDALAASGAAPGEIVAEAGTAIARWWWEGRGDGQPDRIVGLVTELVLWCAVAACEHEAGCERLARAGRVMEAEEAGRRSRALREACGALGGLVGCEALRDDRGTEQGGRVWGNAAAGHGVRP